MIALPQKLPHVIWRNDRLVPLSEGWLAESIEHAAAASGYHRWHLAPEVARAIAVYLENVWLEVVAGRHSMHHARNGAAIARQASASRTSPKAGV